MFYVSTYGGSASVWVARVLSLHPSVVCFHGSTSLPPDVNGRFPPLDPELFAWGMLQCEGACRGSKIFGAIHGFHGTAAKAAFEAYDGVFGGLLRHPVMRLHSLWHGHGRGLPDVRARDGAIAPDDPSAIVTIELQSGAPSLGESVAQFATLCHGTIGGDMELLRNVPRDHVFRTEDVTTNRDAFAEMFNRLTVASPRHLESRIGAAASPEYLDTVFAHGRENVRSANSAAAEETFESWPAIFKLVLASAIQTFGGRSVIDDYEAFGYPLPAALRALGYPQRPEPPLPPPTGPVRLEYSSTATVSSVFEFGDGSGALSGGASFLGYEFIPSHNGAHARLDIAANAYSMSDNEVGLAVFDGRSNLPIFFDSKPVAAGQWVTFEHSATLKAIERRKGVGLDIRIGCMRPGTIIINGPDGEPPPEIGIPFLAITEIAAEGEPREA